MFEDMYIPWTPRLKRRQPKAEPQPAAEVREAKQPQQTATAALCTRTIHVARAIMAHAVAGHPEASAAISSAFIAYVKGALKVQMVGPPFEWKVIP
jgi:hypothetical protein